MPRAIVIVVIVANNKLIESVTDCLFTFFLLGLGFFFSCLGLVLFFSFLS